MAKVKRIDVNEKDLSGSLRLFLQSLLELDTISAILVPRQLPMENRVMPALVTDPSCLKEIEPLAPAYPLNGARIVSRLTRKTTGKKVAAVLRPCEMRAFVELVKLNQGSMEEVVLIGLDCLGAYTNRNYSRFAGGDVQESTRKFYRGVLFGEGSSEEMSPDEGSSEEMSSDEGRSGEGMSVGTRRIEVGALVLCGGTEEFDPSGGKDPLGYGSCVDVVTGLEFERILSGTGPNGGKLLRPSDGKPIRSIAWIQCVGSRDLSIDADFCSGFCCMAAMKEALVARERTCGEVSSTIFYMDMRTFGKTFERYREHAEKEGGVHFQKGRVHTVFKSEKSGDLRLRYADEEGAIYDMGRDLVVLATGRRPAAGMAALSELTGIELNQWGFADTEPFSLSRSVQDGITIGGGFSGPKDIADSVIQASSAALQASRVIHASGGGLAVEVGPGVGRVSDSAGGPGAGRVSDSAGTPDSGRDRAHVGVTASGRGGASLGETDFSRGSAYGAGFHHGTGSDSAPVPTVSVLQKALVVGGPAPGLGGNLWRRISRRNLWRRISRRNLWRRISRRNLWRRNRRRWVLQGGGFQMAACGFPQGGGFCMRSGPFSPLYPRSRCHGRGSCRKVPANSRSSEPCFRQRGGDGAPHPLLLVRPLHRYLSLRGKESDP